MTLVAATHRATARLRATQCHAPQHLATQPPTRVYPSRHVTTRHAAMLLGAALRNATAYQVYLRAFPLIATRLCTPLGCAARRPATQRNTFPARNRHGGLLPGVSSRNATRLGTTPRIASLRNDPSEFTALRFAMRRDSAHHNATLVNLGEHS